MIIEKAYQSAQKDHIKDALSLFVDFMAIFVSLHLAPRRCLSFHNVYMIEACITSDI